MGASHNFHGGDNPIMTDIRSVAPTLETHTGCDVVLESETLTTAQAARTMERKQSLDASAAALILQSYLDRMSEAQDINSRAGDV